MPYDTDDYTRVDEGGVSFSYAQENDVTPGTPGTFSEIETAIGDITINDTREAQREDNEQNWSEMNSSVSLQRAKPGNRTITVDIEYDEVLDAEFHTAILADYEANTSGYLQRVKTDGDAVNTVTTEWKVDISGIPETIRQRGRVRRRASFQAFEIEPEGGWI